MRIFSRTGARRRGALVVVAAMALAGCVVEFETGNVLTPSDPNLVRAGVGAPSLNANAIDKDLSHYVLFALEEGEWKGGNDLISGVVRGGHVGVNKPGFANAPIDSTAPGKRPRLRMAESIHQAGAMDRGTQIVAATSALGRNFNAWDVFAEGGRRFDEPQALVHTETRVTPWPTPVFRANDGDDPVKLEIGELPPMPSFSCGRPADAPVISPPYGGQGGASPAQPLRVDQSSGPQAGLGWGHTTIRGANQFDANPDRWTHLYLADNATYRFCSLRLAGSVWVHMGPNTRVEVVGDFTLGQDNAWGDPSSVTSKLIVQGTSVAFGKNSTFHGNVWAPNAALALGRANDLNGKFWGRSFTSDLGTRINPGGGPPVTTTTTPPTTVPPTTVPPTTVPPTTVPPTTVPPT